MSVRQRPSANRPLGLAASVLGVIALFALAASLSIDAAAQTGPLTFGSGKAVFVPPAGFKTLTAAQRQQLLPTAHASMTVIGDVTRGSTIGYGVVEIKLPRAQLEMFRKYMTETYTSGNVGLKWVVNKLDTVGGRDGIRMEFSDDRQMHHVALFAYVDDDHVATVTYNIPIKEWAQLEKAVRTSVTSLRITP
jgi:hypothetical protein